MKKSLGLFFLFCLIISIGACVYAPVGPESGNAPPPPGRPGYGGDYHREPEHGPGPGWGDRRFDVDIANLEAIPRWFVPGQPIDFVARINNNGPAAAGFDIGIFHEGRLVGWEMDKTLAPGPNKFKVRDHGFTGDAGAYIVRIRRAGHILDEKRFVTNRLPDGRFTINPGP